MLGQNEIRPKRTLACMRNFRGKVRCTLQKDKERDYTWIFSVVWIIYVWDWSECGAVNKLGKSDFHHKCNKINILIN